MRNVLVGVVFSFFVIGMLYYQLTSAKGDDFTTEAHYQKLGECFKRERARLHQHYAAVTSIYDAALYPTAVQIVTGKQKFPDVFDEGVDIRVDQLGYDLNFTLITEYFYVLTARPQSWCSPTGPNGAKECGKAYYLDGEMTKFNSNGTIVTYEWTFRFRYSTGDPLLGSHTIGSLAANITQRGWLRFNCDGKIVSGVLDVPNLLQQAIWTGTDAVTSAQLATPICQTHQEKCAGKPYQQFDNYDQCVNFVNSLPVGNLDCFGVQNSSRCRAFHVVLALYQPEVHCQHLGPLSDPCEDWKLPDFYDDTYYMRIPIGESDPEPCNQDWMECQALVDGKPITPRNPHEELKRKVI